MAGNARIVATVMKMSSSTDTPDGFVEFFLDYQVAGVNLTGITAGRDVLFVVDATQNDAQLTASLRAAVAAYVDPLVIPPQGFTANDVRGCNV